MCPREKRPHPQSGRPLGDREVKGGLPPGSRGRGAKTGRGRQEQTADRPRFRPGASVKKAGLHGGAGPRTKVEPVAAPVDGQSAAAEAIWGRRPILEALRAGTAIDKIFIAENLRPGAARDVERLAAELGVPVQKASRRRLEELAGGDVPHQGLVALLPAAPYADLDDVIGGAGGRAKQPAFIVVLDGIQDPQNLGSILRTAETAGADGVIISKRRAVGLTGAVAKASAGAVSHIPVARVGNIAQTIVELQERGIWVAGADAAAKDLVWDVDLTGPVALVIGAEGEGLSRLVRERCDLLVRLPVMGRVESLNASVAAGIIMYEVVRQRRMAGDSTGIKTDDTGIG